MIPKEELQTISDKMMPRVANWQTAVIMIVEELKTRGWRIVKLDLAATDVSGPEWDTYYVTEEL